MVSGTVWNPKMKLFMITASPSIAKFALENGVDRIFVDLEVLGKAERQGHLDSVKSSHSLADVVAVRSAIGVSPLMVRLNPLNEFSIDEVEDAIAAGADILMLPMFRTAQEVRNFSVLVDGRVPISLLVETADAMHNLSACIEISGVEEVHIGLNDLTLDLGLTFMFEPFYNGLVDAMAMTIRAAGLPFGIGGVARVGEGVLPAESILSEHARLGSSAAILSRTFHRQAATVEEIQSRMNLGREVSELRRAYAVGLASSPSEREETRARSSAAVASIVASMQSQKNTSA
jgi:citrate lyase beta subunit